MCTCLHVFPQSEEIYISSLYSTSLEPRLPEGTMRNGEFYQAWSEPSSGAGNNNRFKLC